MVLDLNVGNSWYEVSSPDLFEGLSIGKKGTSGGEICFNTGMTGYQEIYTDPSYYGQIVINTNAHIGNYGVHKDEDESDRPKIKGLVVNDFTYNYSRSSASGSLENYLSSHDTVGISDLDTRMLVRHVRDKGAMNAIISTKIFDIENANYIPKPSMKPLKYFIKKYNLLAKEAIFFEDIPKNLINPKKDTLKLLIKRL